MARRAPIPISADLHSTRHVPAFMLRGFWDELEKRGVKPSELEQLSGVTRPREHDFQATIPEVAMHRLFESGSAITRDENLGLSVGRAIGTSSFHLVGHLVLASTSLTRAVELVARVQPQLRLRPPCIQPLDATRARVGFDVRDRHPSLGARIEAELTGVLLHDVALHFYPSARAARPVIQLPHAAPTDLTAYRQTFSGGVEFDADGTFVIVPRAALVQRRSGADAALLKQLVGLAQHHFHAPQADASWSARVIQALRVQPAPRLLDAVVLADRLGLSSRGLARRLAREGTNVSNLIDSVLYERAQQLLQHQGATSTEVAEALGYAELSSFFRAFRRWSGGLTPSAYRKLHADKP